MRQSCQGPGLRTELPDSPWFLLLSNTKAAMENGQGYRLPSHWACSVTPSASVCANTTEPHCPSAGTLVGNSGLKEQRAPVFLLSHRLLIFQQEVNLLVNTSVFSTQEALLWRSLLRVKPIHTLDVGEEGSLKGRTLY